MLKRLLTSNTRVKILTIFLLNPDEEYFVRELTRRLDEQINSIRRELDNLKKLGLLRSRMRNRKKFFVVNKNFILFDELRGIILKSMSSNEHIVKKIRKCGNIDFILMSGVFIDVECAVDLLLVGEVDRDALDQFLNSELDMKRSIKFTVLSSEDFIYRVKCKDKFIKELLDDSRNVIALNKFGKIF